MNRETFAKALECIHQRTGFIAPKIGLILGSGLGIVAEQMVDAIEIPYAEIPGMPVSTVAGHAGALVFGTLQGVSVVCMKGRVHWYEGMTAYGFKFPIRLMKLLGCQELFITNSSGSLRREVGAGELVVVRDHINFQFLNPLVGPNDDEFGPRFFPMDDAYDIGLREDLKKVAETFGFTLHEGVYLSVQGPNFETPAEIRAFRLLGADLVGMSTIPEVLVARHCGLKVAVISNVTNLAADISEEQLTHEGTLYYSQKSIGKLIQLMTGYLGYHGHKLK